MGSHCSGALHWAGPDLELHLGLQLFLPNPPSFPLSQISDLPQSEASLCLFYSFPLSHPQTSPLMNLLYFKLHLSSCFLRIEVDPGDGCTSECSYVRGKIICVLKTIRIERLTEFQGLPNSLIRGKNGGPSFEL